eukprot:5338103-Amphidinium_carterae.2
MPVRHVHTITQRVQTYLRVACSMPLVARHLILNQLILAMATARLHVDVVACGVTSGEGRACGSLPIHCSP